MFIVEFEVFLLEILVLSRMPGIARRSGTGRAADSDALLPGSQAHYPGEVWAHDVHAGGRDATTHAHDY